MGFWSDLVAVVFAGIFVTSYWQLVSKTQTNKYRKNITSYALRGTMHLRKLHS